MTNLNLKFLNVDDLDLIMPLVKQLNPDLDTIIIKERQVKMFSYNNYLCFGFYDNEKLIGLCSGWETVRIYCGKQLEIDNVIVDSKYQSGGYGKQFIKIVSTWSKNNNFETIELNAYVQNTRAHKFYLNQDFKIIGYHFQKNIE